MSNYLTLPIAALLVSLCSVATAVESADPMRPDDYTRKMADGKGAKVTTKKPAAISYWVQSIQIGDGQRSATINGRLLKVGDTIRAPNWLLLNIGRSSYVEPGS